MSIPCFTSKPIKYSNKIIIKYLGKVEEMYDEPLKCNDLSVTDMVSDNINYVININKNIYIYITLFPLIIIPMGIIIIGHKNLTVILGTS